MLANQQQSVGVFGTAAVEDSFQQCDSCTVPYFIFGLWILPTPSTVRKRNIPKVHATSVGVIRTEDTVAGGFDLKNLLAADLDDVCSVESIFRQIDKPGTWSAVRNRY